MAKQQPIPTTRKPFAALRLHLGSTTAQRFDPAQLVTNATTEVEAVRTAIAELEKAPAASVDEELSKLLPVVDRATLALSFVKTLASDAATAASDLRHRIKAAAKVGDQAQVLSLQPELLLANDARNKIVTFRDEIGQVLAALEKDKSRCAAEKEASDEAIRRQRNSAIWHERVTSGSVSGEWIDRAGNDEFDPLENPYPDRGQAERNDNRDQDRGDRNNRNRERRFDRAPRV